MKNEYWVLGKRERICKEVNVFDDVMNKSSSIWDYIYLSDNAKIITITLYLYFLMIVNYNLASMEVIYLLWF